MKKNVLVIYLMSFLLLGFIPSLTSCSKDKDEIEVKDEDKDKDEVKDEDKDKDENISAADALQGDNYYLFILDETSEGAIKTKIKSDFRPDDTNRFLYVWEDTYQAGATSGPNYFGEVEGWTSLVVGNKGWSGCGFTVTSEIDFTAVDDDYVFHIGMKSKDNSSHVIIFYGHDGDKVVEAKVCIGKEELDGVQPSLDFERNGEWQTIAIPMADLFDQGLRYSKAFEDENVLAFLSGGVAGTTLDIDAAFIYKPKAK